MLTALWGEPENGQKCDLTYVCDYKIYQVRTLLAFTASAGQYIVILVISRY